MPALSKISFRGKIKQLLMALAEFLGRLRHNFEESPGLSQAMGQLKFVETDDLLLEVEEDGRHKPRFVYVEPEVADSFVGLLKAAKVDIIGRKVVVRVTERTAEFPGRIEVVVSQTDREVVNNLANILNGNTATDFVGLSQLASQEI